MLAVLAEDQDRLAELCGRYCVVRLELFGSAARGDDFDPARSDVDLLVEFTPGSDLDPLAQVFDLKAALEALFERPVDLVEAGAVKNPYLRASIERSRRLLYELSSNGCVGSFERPKKI
jgi:predicted nucleotidyltransferase